MTVQTRPPHHPACTLSSLCNAHDRLGLLEETTWYPANRCPSLHPYIQQLTLQLEKPLHYRLDWIKPSRKVTWKESRVAWAALHTTGFQ